MILLTKKVFLVSNAFSYPLKKIQVGFFNVEGLIFGMCC